MCISESVLARPTDSTDCSKRQRYSSICIVLFKTKGTCDMSFFLDNIRRPIQIIMKSIIAKNDFLRVSLLKTMYNYISNR